MIEYFTKKMPYPSFCRLVSCCEVFAILIFNRGTLTESPANELLRNLLPPFHLLQGHILLHNISPFLVTYAFMTLRFCLQNVVKVCRTALEIYLLLDSLMDMQLTHAAYGASLLHLEKR